MKIIGLQYDIAWENPELNFRAVSKMLEQSPPQEGTLVVLPEMFATGFSMNADLTRQAGKPSEEFITGISEKYSCYTLGGLVENAADGHPYNYACLRNPNGTRALRYKKIHQFSDERFNYAAGHRVCTVNIEGMSICPLICYDLRFPETFRKATLAGVELFIIIASWPSSRIEHWKTLLKARAIENQAYVLGVNRTGNSPEHEYNGQSILFDYTGKQIANLGDQEGIISAELSLEAIQEYRSKFPFLRGYN